MENKTDKILIADDEQAIRIGLSELLKEEGYSVDCAEDGQETLNKLNQDQYALLLADLKMPKYDGLKILRKIRKAGMDTEVIIITGKGTISTAVRAMKAGAYDYLTKPVESERLKSIIPKVMEHYHLRVSHKNLQQQIRQLTHYEDLVGQSEQMQQIYKTIEAVADSTANIIVTGESGTGKELVARAIHRKSGRQDQPFVAVNCSAFPEQILENELFGHEKGAFTGALTEKPGCFELAHRGTLFLDEVGDMALETQARILRALEERSFRRLGGKKEIQVDVRIIAATNRDLQKAMEEKQFREDLYYRLCVVEVDIPPLRERLDDVPLLIEEFLDYFNQKNNKQIKGLTPKCRDLLLNYPWPGNVRELKNTIERAVILTNASKIDVGVIPDRIVRAEKLQSKIAAGDIGQQGPSVTIPIGTKMEDAERKIILETLQYTNNNKTETAKVLGVSLKTIHNKLGKYKD